MRTTCSTGSICAAPSRSRSRCSCRGSWLRNNGTLPATGRKLTPLVTAMVNLLQGKRMKSPFYTADHEAWRAVVRRFVENEIEPHAHEWDEAGEFPRELYVKAAAIGLLGLGFPEEYGGTP